MYIIEIVYMLFLAHLQLRNHLKVSIPFVFRESTEKFFCFKVNWHLCKLSHLIKCPCIFLTLTSFWKSLTSHRELTMPIYLKIHSISLLHSSAVHFSTWYLLHSWNKKGIKDKNTMCCYFPSFFFLLSHTDGWVPGVVDSDFVGPEACII